MNCINRASTVSIQYAFALVNSPMQCLKNVQNQIAVYRAVQNMCCRGGSLTLPLTQQARTAKLMLLGRFFSQFTAQPTNAGGRVNDPPLQRARDKLEFAKKGAAKCPRGADALCKVL